MSEELICKLTKQSLNHFDIECIFSVVGKGKHYWSACNSYFAIFKANKYHFAISFEVDITIHFYIIITIFN